MQLEEAKRGFWAGVQSLPALTSKELELAELSQLGGAGGGEARLDWIPQRTRALSALLAALGISPCLPASLFHWPTGQRCACWGPRPQRERAMSNRRTWPPLSAGARHHLFQLLSLCLCLSLSILQPRTHSEQEEAGGLIGPKEGEDTGAKEESVRGDQ